MGSSEGASLARVFGRCRVAGHLIWSSRFLEAVNEEEVGGKGGGTTMREYSYSVSIAIALCEGEVSRIGRIWADGLVIDQSGIAFRLHPGTESQLPDPVIAAIEGSENAPAYRGTAYVVLENLDLTHSGVNTRSSTSKCSVGRPTGCQAFRGLPGTTFAGWPRCPGPGNTRSRASRSTSCAAAGRTSLLTCTTTVDCRIFDASLDQLAAELPNVKSVSLVVSWFGNDLRCGRCALRPAVEQSIEDGDPMSWSVSGIGRSAAATVSRIDGRPVFGGTPADASVVQAIERLRSHGQSVMFYPFILMDIPGGDTHGRSVDGRRPISRPCHGVVDHARPRAGSSRIGGQGRGSG